MELRYDFSEDEFLALCLKNLERKKTTVYEDIDEALEYFLSTPVSVLITDVKHRNNSRYYDPHLSLKEYMDLGKISLSYFQFDLSSHKDTDLDVKDIIFPSFVKLLDFQYGEGVTRKYNIKNTKLKTKNKTSINLLTVEIPLDFLNKLFLRMKMPLELLPSKLGMWEWRQTFYNKKTGESFFCSCFKTALAKKREEILNMHSHLKNALVQNSFKDSICHICTQTNSDLIYCSSAFRGGSGNLNNTYK